MVIFGNFGYPASNTYATARVSIICSITKLSTFLENRLFTLLSKLLLCILKLCLFLYLNLCGNHIIPAHYFFVKGRRTCKGFSSSGISNNCYRRENIQYSRGIATEALRAT